MSLRVPKKNTSKPFSMEKQNKPIPILNQLQRTNLVRLSGKSNANGSDGDQIDDEKKNISNELEFKPNKPISLPSLENPVDAGPLYNTCRSITGVESGTNVNEDEDNIEKEEVPFIPNKPIQLESLKNQEIDRSFLGLQPRSDDYGDGSDGEVPLLMETGLGVFTSSVILGGSIYFILAVFLDGENVDPTAIPLSF